MGLLQPTDPGLVNNSFKARPGQSESGYDRAQSQNQDPSPEKRTIFPHPPAR